MIIQQSGRFEIGEELASLRDRDPQFDGHSFNGRQIPVILRGDAP